MAINNYIYNTYYPEKIFTLWAGFEFGGLWSTRRTLPCHHKNSTSTSISTVLLPQNLVTISAVLHISYTTISIVTVKPLSKTAQLILTMAVKFLTNLIFWCTGMCQISELTCKLPWKSTGIYDLWIIETVETFYTWYKHHGYHFWILSQNTFLKMMKKQNARLAKTMVCKLKCL